MKHEIKGLNILRDSMDLLRHPSVLSRIIRAFSVLVHRPEG